MELVQGHTFGQWTLIGESPLGEGGNGVVWEAEKIDGKRGAIKFLKSGRFGEIREKRFRDEIEFLKNESNRPGILPLIDSNLPPSCSKNDRLWFATPLATPFANLKLSGDTNLTELVQKIGNIAQTLVQLHEEKKWHRDLKPENLFVLNDNPVIGDFGLIDFPNKDAITTKTEILGPLFYVAPEMMGDAANKPAGPADVYSLAKTLWVLASGQRYPLPGEQRIDNPALRLSTYCRHAWAHILDALMERATSYDPSRRPTMREFAGELSAWLQIGTVTQANINLEMLAKECQSVFEPGIRAQRDKEQLILASQSVLISFNRTLERISVEMLNITNITPTMNQWHELYKRFHFPEYTGGARSVWRQARLVEIRTNIEPVAVFLQGFVQVEAINNEKIRILIGYLIQPIIHGEAVIPPKPWTKESIAPRGSAQLKNDSEVLQAELLANLGQAIRSFTEKVKQFQNK
jgi:serine/threonine protein kinase